MLITSTLKMHSCITYMYAGATCHMLFKNVYSIMMVNSRHIFTLMAVILYSYVCQAEPSMNDSISARELKEVVVTAPDVVKKGESSVFYPDSRLKESTRDACQVIAGLQIPELIVDLSSGAISALGKDDLLILINGRPSSQYELAAIPSKNIVKVEYISNPGARYKNYGAVILSEWKQDDAGRSGTGHP